MDELAHALISIYQRAELGDISLHLYSEDRLAQRGQIDEKQLKAQIAKFLPPILCTIVSLPGNPSANDEYDSGF